MKRPDVPREKVEELAAQIRQLYALKAEQAHTQAKLIRGCIAALKQTPEKASRRLERERRHLPGVKAIVRVHEPGKKVREDKALAFLHLEWLATQLEDVR